MGTGDNDFLIVQEASTKLGVSSPIDKNFVDKNFCIYAGAESSLLENRSNKEYPRNIEIQKKIETALICEISFNTDAGANQSIEIYTNPTTE